ncbi:MAG TPA: TetR/AcrR family transcriptional regulator [Nocardia sp.]|uniref:TetR/AcrR family transcriptional regulator n=1 Tax=Nocardia TaxID=1817 RepID=UPI002454F6E7|nr:MULTISPECIES: TetR/AcrR family transcriptional regulator [Nocardia]HLS76563.1 TetR/AcrR family transcriptional regulator [Nocardia sp.]
MSDIPSETHGGAVETEHSPGSVRPGGRTARVRAEVLRAAGDLLTERGFDGLDLTEVAARAGVGRTTVYRRWGTPTAVVADLLADMAEQSVPRADTGSLRGDLTANARLIARTLTDPRQGRLFLAVIAAATCDHGARTALHRFYDVRLTEWAGCVTDAIGRGEAPSGTDPRAVLSAVAAPLYYRLLASGDPVDDATAVMAAEAALAAVAAGVFVTAR